MLKLHRRRAFAGAATALSVAAALGAPTPVSAETVTRTVPYADLDLTQPHDVSRLHLRVATAVRSVCAVRVGGPFEVRQATGACLAQARASAAPQVVAVVRDARRRAGLPDAGTLVQASAP